MRRLALRLLPLAALWLGATATAQPTVVVRAEARVDLAAEHRDGRIVVRGAIVDDLGAPLARRPVIVGIHDGSERSVRIERVVSDGEGAFELQTPGPAGTYTLTARFEGDAFHPRLAVERTVDLTRAPTTLSIRVESAEIDLDAPSVTVELRAESRRGGHGLPIEVHDELGRRLGEVTTDAEGRARLSLRGGGALGEPGAGRLVAHTPGDALRASGRVETPVVRVRRATLTLGSSATRFADSATIVLSGELSTSAGPSPGEAIGLFAGETHLDTALTDPTGRFEAEIAATDLPSREGPIELRARFESDGPGTPDAESPAVIVQRRGGALAIWAWLALPLALSVFALLWLRRRAPVVVRASIVPPPPVGVIRAAPSRRRPGDRRIGGVLVDVADRPLEGSVRAEPAAGGDPVVAQCDAEGRFALELGDGDWTLLWTAPRHAPAQAPVTIPHRGDLEGLRVRLETWRARALAFLRERFTNRGESPDRWRKTTIHSLRDDPGLGPAAAEVEVAYYGPVEPDGAQIERLGRGPGSPS